MTNDHLQSYLFSVGDSPCAVWGYGLRDENLRFLDGIDATYFEYVVRKHTDELAGENAHRAAIAIRTAYHHALETFFSLLCAAFQAPGCVAGWLSKCRDTKQLRDLVRLIRHGSDRIRNRLGLDVVSFSTIADRVFAGSDADESRRAANVARFARLWARLADDFVLPAATGEYNSLKHGFRVQTGGVGLSLVLESAPGVPAPDAQPATLGGGQFGSTFPVGVPIGQSKPNPHFRLRQQSLNWLPDANALATILTSVSLGNILAFLKRAHGRRGKEVHYVWPADPAAFEQPWALMPMMPEVCFDLHVDAADIVPATQADILDRLDRSHAARREARTSTRAEQPQNENLSTGATKRREPRAPTEAAAEE